MKRRRSKKLTFDLPDPLGWGAFQEEALAYAQALYKDFPNGVARENAFVGGADWAIMQILRQIPLGTPLVIRVPEGNLTRGQWPAPMPEDGTGGAK